MKFAVVQHDTICSLHELPPGVVEKSGVAVVEVPDDAETGMHLIGGVWRHSDGALAAMAAASGNTDSVGAENVGAENAA